MAMDLRAHLTYFSSGILCLSQIHNSYSGIECCQVVVVFLSTWLPSTINAGRKLSSSSLDVYETKNQENFQLQPPPIEVCFTLFLCIIPLSSVRSCQVKSHHKFAVFEKHCCLSATITHTHSLPKQFAPGLLQWSSLQAHSQEVHHCSSQFIHQAAHVAFLLQCCFQSAFS